MLDLVDLGVRGEEEVNRVDEGMVVVQELLLILDVFVFVIQNFGQSRLNKEKNTFVILKRFYVVFCRGYILMTSYFEVSLILLSTVIMLFSKN